MDHWPIFQGRHAFGDAGTWVGPYGFNQTVPQRARLHSFAFFLFTFHFFSSQPELPA
jgi:hypothetical protein